MLVRGQKCAYCLRRTSGFCILCNQCSELRLCIECFLCGVEGGKHKKCHGYTIEKTDSSVPEYLFDPIWPTESAWRYHEELKLVGALETYGYGNWSEIASCVTDRTPIECKTHYDRFYITGLIGACTTATHNHLCYRVFDHTDSESNLQLPHSPHISPDGQSALGYMPCRDEFEYEFMNNAESVITAIPFGNISDELYRDLQLSLVDIYNRRLEARFMRHSVALEYDLVTHLMRDLRSGHETCRTSQSLRRLRRTCVRGGRRVFRYRSMNDRRRKPGHAHRSTFTGRRRKARFQCTDTVTESTPYVRISPLDVTHVARSATNNSSLKPDKNGQEAVKPVFDQISRQGKQRSRSFENLCTSGDHLGLFNERTECSTCLLSNGNVMGNHISESVHSKLSHCTPPCSLSCASVTNCPNLSSENGSTSSENTDSGVFSGDSCAQSTVSTASNSTDTFAPTSVPVTTASQGFIRRLRSRSDSFDPASLTKTHRTKPFDFFASLIELRRKDNRVSHNIAPVEVGDWTTEEMTKQQICELPNSSKTITKIAQENNNADQSRGLLVAACAHRKPHENSYQLCSKKIGHESNFFVEYPWLKPFARFLNKSELSSLTENLSREQQLRSEIQQLMGHHKRGVRCMKDMCLKPTARIVHDTSVYINETTDSMHNQSSVPMDTLTSARARKLGSSRRMNCKLHPASARPRGRPRKLNSHQGKSPVHRGLSKRGMKQKRAGPGRPRTRF